MSSTTEYAKRIQTILSNNNQFQASTVGEARVVLKQIVQVQRELRQIKKEIGLTMKSLRSEYADQKEHVSGGGFSKGVMQGIFGKKSVARMDAAQKDRIRRTQVDHLEPFQELQRRIDNILIEYDKQKLLLERWIAEQS